MNLKSHLYKVVIPL